MAAKPRRLRPYHPSGIYSKRASVPAHQQAATDLKSQLIADQGGEAEISAVKMLLIDIRLTRIDHSIEAESLAEVDAALAKARDVPGPVVICVRTDRAANLGVAADPGMRFAEVYQGPM